MRDLIFNLLVLFSNKEAVEMLFRALGVEFEVIPFRSIFVRVPKVGELWWGNGEFVVSRPAA